MAVSEQKNKKRVLVTGATGFVGSNILDFLGENFIVRMFAREKINNDKHEIFLGDLLKQEDVAKALENVDIVVHMAAMILGNEKEIFDFNVNSTKILVEESKKKKIEKFVFISSENVLWPGQSAYGKSKIEGEKIVQTFENNLILRCSVVYGKGNEINLGRILSMVKNKRFVVIPGNGKSKMQPIFAPDIGIFIVNGINQGLKGEYIIAGPLGVSMNDFVKTAAKALNKKVTVIHVPKWFLFLPLKIMESVIKNPPIKWSQVKNLNTERVYNISKTIEDFKHTPSGIEEGLKSIFQD